jgi:hypothetical protein
MEDMRMTRGQVSDVNEEAIFADGFENALIGVTADGQAVYDRDECIRILRRRDGMTRESAVEFQVTNVEFYLGEHSPVFVTLGRSKSLKRQ